MSQRRKWAIYGELSKVEEQDDGTLKVFGIASSGNRDDAGEIVLPSAMKAALPAYSAFPAVREQHNPAIAAGTAVEVDVDDDGLTHIVAHVVDPGTVKKVRHRVLRGFSIGGQVLKRDPNDPTTITSIRLSEISLVDRPANPDATVTMFKLGGARFVSAPSDDPFVQLGEALANAGAEITPRPTSPEHEARLLRSALAKAGIPRTPYNLRKAAAQKRRADHDAAVGALSAALSRSRVQEARLAKAAPVQPFVPDDAWWASQGVKRATDGKLDFDPALCRQRRDRLAAEARFSTMNPQGEMRH